MNKETRNSIRVRVQVHPDISALRNRLEESMNQLPVLGEKYKDKSEALARLFLGGKMPKRVVVMQRGHYGVRPCVGGIVFTALVISALGGKENAKLAVPLSRLADAISYHFRNSRMRGKLEYNLDAEQAKQDAEYMHPQLEEVAKLLISCGVPVMGAPIGEIQFANRAELPYPSAEPNDWGIQILGLTKRVCELENTLTLAQDLYERLERAEKICNAQQLRSDRLEARVKAIEMQKLYAPTNSASEEVLAPDERPVLLPNPSPTIVPGTAIPTEPKVWCEAKL